MRPTLASAWLAVVLLIGLATQHADAQTCSTNTIQSTCYADSNCHWEPYTGVCAEGAPTTCAMFYMDGTGCTSTSGCTQSDWTGQCVNASPDVTHACHSHTTSESCTGATAPACFWSPYSPLGARRCWQSMAEETFYYPVCLIWSNYDSSVAPSVCNSGRNCQFTGNNLCTELTALVPAQDNQVSMNWTYTIENMGMVIPASLTFQIKETFPIGQYFNPASPALHAVIFGFAPSGTAAMEPLQPSECNSVQQAHPAFFVGEPKVDPPFADHSALLQYFIDYYTTISSLDSFIQDAIYDTVGYTKWNTLLPPISLAYAVDGVVWAYASQTLPFLVSRCNATRQTINADETRYTIPVTTYYRQGDNVAATTEIFSQAVTTWGFYSLGAAMTNKVDVRVVSQFTNGAGLGTKKRTPIVYLTFRYSDPTRVVGLRGLNDVSMFLTGGQDVQPAGAPTNCFGMHPVAVVPPSETSPTLCTFPTGTTDYCSTTRVDFESREAVSRADGDSLNKCAYQLSSVRIEEMDGDIAYPSALDYKQSFYVFPKQWLRSEGPTGTVVSVGKDFSGNLGDLIGVTLVDKTYASTAELVGNVEPPTFGILPLPTSGPYNLQYPQTDVGNGVMFDLRNDALSSDYLLGIGAVYMDQAARESFELYFRDTSVIYPTDAAGHVIVDEFDAPVGSIPFANIIPFLTYTTRAHIGAKAAVLNPPNIGTDAFFIRPSILRALLPSVGYKFDIYYEVKLPGFDGTGEGTEPAGGLNRRLLQVSDGNNSTGNGTDVIQEGSTTIIIVLPEDHTVTYLYADGRVSSNRDWVMGVAAGLIGLMVLLGIGFYFMLAHNEANSSERYKLVEPLSSITHGKMKSTGRSRSVSRSRG